MKGKSLYILFFILLAGMLLPSGTAEAAAKKVKLNKTSVTLVKGKSATIKFVNAPKLAKMSRKDKKNLKWTTSNSKVVKITSKSKSVKQVTVKAVKTGKATIKVKYKGRTYKCKVTVKKTNNRKPESTTEHTSEDEITETPAAKKAVPVPDQPTNEVQTVYTGEELVLSAHLSDGDKSAYTYAYGVSLELVWSVKDTDILTKKTGNYRELCRLNALKQGTTTVTAKDKVSGLTFTWTVKVVESPFKQKYTYKSYALGKVSAINYHSVCFTSGEINPTYVYIRTDNPGDGERKMVMVFDGVEWSNSVITQKSAEARPFFSQGVPGGYLIEVNQEHKEGSWAVREYDVDGRHYYDTPLCAVEYENCNEQYDEWLDTIITMAGARDTSLTAPEKVQKLADYVRNYFYYTYNNETYEESQKLSFMINQADSLSSTHFVHDMAEKLGITVRLMYGDYDRDTEYAEWLTWHSQVELVDDGVTYHYKCCPYLTYNPDKKFKDFDLTPYQ